MPAYRVHFRTVAELSVTVEADSEEEAVDTAYDNEQFLCAHCSGWGKDWDLELGEWEPTDNPWPVMEAYPAVEPL